MIGSSIRGGQILVHQFRMLKQILKIGFLISFVLSVLFYGYRVSNKLPRYDYAATYSYFIAEFYNNIADSFTNSLFSNRESHSSIINAYINNDWSYAYKYTAKNIAASFRFIKAKNEFIAMLKEELLSALGFLLFSLIVVFSIWYWYGRKTKEHEITRGTKVNTAKEVASYLNRKKISSDFRIGEMPLVKDSETSHILVTGTTGAGKSNLFNTLLPQIRKKDQPAVVVDLTGDLIARYYNPERGDIIFNPFDVRGHSWDFWEETSKLSYLHLVASSLYVGRGNNDEMWNNASKKVFIDSVKAILARDKRSIKSLYELLAINPLHEMAERLRGTSSSSLLDPKNDKTAMSIRTNTIAFIEWMEYLTESEKKFSMQNWVHNSVKYGSSGWLFLASTPEQRSMLSPLFRVMIELFVNSLMELGPDYKRRFWLIVDELPAIKKLPSLPLALAEFRKYGGCILSGLQSMNQFTEQYGYYEAATMFGQFNTKFIFRTDEQNIANQISEMFGKVEYQESSENLSYGAHEMRDGVSFGKVERTKLLVTIDDLASLQNLECYVKLPDAHCRIAKIKMEYKELEIIAPHSVPIKVEITKDKISDNIPGDERIDLQEELELEDSTATFKKENQITIKA